MVTTDIDSAKRQTDLTQFCQDALADAGMIPMANPYTVNCYWPWLKNYYGEVEAGSHNQIPMIARMWIDQKLKKSLGYQ
jgi:peptide/nickel transport system substrate-binding protein